MNLKLKFIKYSDYELISIAEPHSDYTDEETLQLILLWKDIKDYKNMRMNIKKYILKYQNNF